MPDLSDVFGEHDIFTPRGYANECCHCGWESDLSKPPEGQGDAHLADVLEPFLTARVGDAAAGRRDGGGGVKGARTCPQEPSTGVLTASGADPRLSGRPRTRTWLEIEDRGKR